MDKQEGTEPCKRENDNWVDKLSDLRRDDLDNNNNNETQESDSNGADELQGWPISNLTFVRVDGIVRSWDSQQEEHNQQAGQIESNNPNGLPRRMYLMEDALTGLHSQGAYVAYAVIGGKTGVNYYMGISLQSPPAGLDNADLTRIEYEIQKSILHSVYNGVEFNKEPFSSEDIKTLIEPKANYVGISTGFAALKNSGDPTLDTEQLERIVTGLQGSDFGMLILAAPVPQRLLAEEQLDILTAQKNSASAANETSAVQEKFSAVQDAYLNHVQLGEAIGHWQVGVYYFASGIDVFERLTALLKTTYTNEQLQPQPLRTLIIKGAREHLLNLALLRNQRNNMPSCNSLLSTYKFLTPLNSRMLSAFIHLPKREMPGFSVRRSAEFSRHLPALKTPHRSISIGNILDRGADTGTQYSIDLGALLKHALVSGVPSSGKTNTAFHILNQLEHHKMPFLIVEPNKTEYRQMLLGSENFTEARRVFTIADETVSPFRLNPFEVQNGVKLQAHIGALNFLFNISFEMYAPMPQVLEKALRHIYMLRGWDIIQNKNRRLPPGVTSDDANCPEDIFPNMKDLYEVIDSTVESFRYSDRIGPDVSAALKTRIGSLLSSGKGQVLSSRRSIHCEQIYAHPTVVELKEVTDESEKSFFTGMLLLHLYEYRKSIGARNELQHVLLIEDAQHLLRRQASSSDPSNMNPAAIKGSAFFTKMLTEFSSLGEGIIMTSPSPCKLDEEVLANTNLKIMHRIVSPEDRDIMGSIMNLDEFQKRHFSALGQGRAIVIDERSDRPFHLEIMYDKFADFPNQTAEESEQMVKDATPLAVAQDEKFDKYSGCKFCLNRCDSAILETATLVADDTISRDTFNRYVLTTQKDLNQLVHFRAQIIHDIQRVIGGRARSGNLTGITWCALTQATERYFQRKGEENWWYFDQVKEQRLRWLNLLRPAFQPSEANRRLDISVLREWRDNFVELHKRGQGPYTTCGPCKSKCLYRFEVSEAISDPKIKFDFNSIINRTDMPASEAVASFCDLLAQRMIGQANADLAFCLAVHLVKEQQLSSDAQMVLLHKVRTALEKDSL